MKVAQMSMLKIGLGNHLWLMMFWCVKFWKNFMKTEYSPWRHYQYISLKLPVLFFMKLYQLNWIFGNCPYVGCRSFLQMNIEWNVRAVHRAASFCEESLNIKTHILFPYFVYIVSARGSRGPLNFFFQKYQLKFYYRKRFTAIYWVACKKRTIFLSMSKTCHAVK